MSEKSFVTSLFIVLLVVGLLPVFVMIIDSFFHLKSLDIFTSKTLQSFKNSLALSFAVATMTTIIGTMLGVLFSKTNFRYSKVYLILFIIPLLLPSFIIALGWVDVVGVKSSWLFGFFGTLLVLFSVYLPIPILLSIFFLKQINSHFEEAARLMTGEFGVLKGIVLPLIKPALMLSFLLVFILSFGEIGVANVLRYEVFSLESFTQFSAFYNSKSAMILAMPMVLVVALIVLLEKIYIKNSSFRYKSFNTAYKISLSSKMQFFAFLSVSLLALFVVILPLISLFSEMGELKTALDKAWLPLQRSLIYSFLGASLLMIFGFLYGYIIEKRLSFSSTLDMGILFLFALPSTVMGISLILFFNTSLTEFIYTTPLIVLFGYFAKYLALTTKIAQTKLSSIPTSMIEAAQMSGANWLQRLLYILLPLSKKTLVAMFMVGFIFTLRESSITQLVYPAGYETLPVYILTQMANGKPEIIASLCLILVSVMMVPLFALLYVGESHDRV